MNHIVNNKIETIDLGLIDYKKAWDFQEELLQKIVEKKISNRNNPKDKQDETPNYLVFCQHPHVYTLGKSGSIENLLIDKKGLENINAGYYRINRGGDITYHGPGQIVCYPILDLENFFTDIHRYLRFLEEAVIRTCDSYNLNAGRIEGLTGVWIDPEPEKSTDNIWNPRKICAIGVKTSRWVTMHGLAFNVNTQLDYFNYIVPCGIQDKDVTSLSKELNTELDTSEVMQQLKSNIISIFEMIEIS